ncbi:MAG TPA: hypothetical protein VFC63_03510 [Blastocatellia bacterium]|nr:hypothetical protein [Blastocatellia bacterium]
MNMNANLSYIKEAIKEPVNIWSMVGFAAAAAYMQSPIPLVAALVTEATYLATVPASNMYKKLVERRVMKQQLEARTKAREELIKTFDPREREAVEYLRWMKNQIYQNYKKFTRLKQVPIDIQRLDSLWESFVDLLDIYRRCKQHLRTINRQAIQNQVTQAERSLAAADEITKPLYERNLEILRKRLQTMDDIERVVKRIEAQLQSIENFFGLVNDQVVTMPTPEHLSMLDFDSLLSSIEMTKEILQETAPMMSALEGIERDSTAALRPMQQRARE